MGIHHLPLAQAGDIRKALLSKVDSYLDAYLTTFLNLHSDALARRAPSLAKEVLLYGLVIAAGRTDRLSYGILDDVVVVGDAEGSLHLRAGYQEGGPIARMLLRLGYQEQPLPPLVLDDEIIVPERLRDTYRGLRAFSRSLCSVVHSSEPYSARDPGLPQIVIAGSILIPGRTDSVLRVE